MVPTEILHSYIMVLEFFMVYIHATLAILSGQMVSDENLN